MKRKSTILTWIREAGYWISEIASPIGTKRNGEDRFEPHIEKMLEAIDSVDMLLSGKLN